MEYYSVPADFKKETIDEYVKLNNSYENAKVLETYGNITVNNDMESGRVLRQLPKIDLLDLKEYIEYSKKRGVNFNYTLNATTLQNKEFSEEGIVEIKQFLKNLYEAGVRSLTIALPSLIEIVKATNLEFSIKASTLCQITNASKALAYKNMGIERIVADESVNRNFKTLRQISRAFGDKVEVIVNPLCLKDCIYRYFHYNQISCDSAKKSNGIGTDYFEHRCVLQRYGDISNMLKICWIRPEDIDYYTQVGIHYFKLQGRHLVLKGDVVKTVKAYFDKSFDGDLMDIINMFYTINNFKVYLDNKKLNGFIEPFYKDEQFCQNDCTSCNYCSNFAQKVIDYKQADNIIRLAKDFYKNYDKFNQAILADDLDKKNEELNIEFDI